MDLVFNRAKNEIFAQNLDLANDTIKTMLVTPDFIADPDMGFADDGTLLSPANFECDGTGYEGGCGGSGRHLLENKFFQQDDQTNKARFFASNSVWNPINCGLVGGILIIKENGGSDEETELIAYVQSGGFPQLTDGGQFEVRWSDNGILAV